jgi:hypothetical protein
MTTTVVGRLLRQFGAGLLRRHVRGVPVGPVRVALPGAFLVLAVGGFRTSQRACQFICGAERSHTRVDAPGKPRRDSMPECGESSTFYNSLLVLTMWVSAFWSRLKTFGNSEYRQFATSLMQPRPNPGKPQRPEGSGSAKLVERLKALGKDHKL